MDYELKVEQNKKRNEKFIKEFESWLTEKNLVNKTIRKNISNIDLYINDYLTYYDITKMEEGISCVYSFLDGWFIEKCLWASKNSLKETAASIKKFYQCMSEKNYISKDKYQEIYDCIKENMDEFLEQVDDYDNGTYYEMFD